ncbi:MAG: LolA family protein [Janthinobacterium lividum]
MRRRDVLGGALGLLAGCAGVPPAGALDAADLADVARVERYLDAIRTLRARFVQEGAGPGGAGTAWLERPGRLRLQYDPPSRAVLVAARGRVVLADGATGGSSSLPLARTPLDILLAPRIVLSGAVTVISVERGPGVLAVALRSTERPGQGRLTLGFAEGPLALRALEMVDGRGDVTRLALHDVATGVAVDESLFGLPGA